MVYQDRHALEVQGRQRALVVEVVAASKCIGKEGVGIVVLGALVVVGGLIKKFPVGRGFARDRRETFL